MSVNCDDTNIEILSDYDLVTILSNLIDNSIDAVNTNISEERQIMHMTEKWCACSAPSVYL